MEKGKKKEEEEEQAVAAAAAAWASFPSDLLPEILSRVPYRSLCRFKCVSMAWLALCSDPAVRKRSPQALSGFFCRFPRGPLSVEGGIRFLNLSGRGRPMVDPSLRFLSGVGAVEVYSSDTGEWTSMASRWGPEIKLLGGEPGHIFFFNRTLHFRAYYCGEDTFDSEGNINIKLLIVTVDMDGSTWKTIRMPPNVFFSFIGQSQGHLYGVEVDRDCRISVWVLEDYASGHWTLKHTASVLELLERPCRDPCELSKLVAIHPECNLIFFIGGVKPEETLVSYDMDNKKLHVICTLEEYDTGTFQPYIPCFAERPSAAR